jgi:flagellar protein FlbT
MAMALRFDLGPFDELHIGSCVLKNSHERALFVVEGDMPILRAKDVIPPALAVSCLEKLYCCVQRMYLEKARDELQGEYLALAAGSLKEDPTLYAELHAADQLIAAGQYYKALKSLKKLTRKELFGVHKSASETYVPRFGGWKR